MIKNETLVAENVEIDMETLNIATKQGFTGNLARWNIMDAIIDALDPEDRKKLEAYREQ